MDVFQGFIYWFKNTHYFNHYFDSYGWKFYFKDIKEKVNKHGNPSSFSYESAIFS